MKIKSISWFETGKGVFLSKYGLVKTEDGEEFIYTLEYNNDTWTDEDDYFDNIKSDFLNECDCTNFGNDEMGLFVKKKFWQ